jgi:hypothetical protein
LDPQVTAIFPGFPDFRANVTFVPIQFFTVVVPHCSRGCVRIVGHALRRLLGWVDEHGNPTQEQVRFTYRELIERAGVSRDSIAEALREAIDKGFLRCIQEPKPDRPGQPAQNGVYEIHWDAEGRYTDNPDQFQGFYYPEAAVIPVAEAGAIAHRPKAARKNIPNAFFDVLLPAERLSVIRVVGAMMFYSIQWGPGGERKVPVTLSISELSRLTRLSRKHVHEAVTEARERGYIERVDGGSFDPHHSRAATYAIRWVRSAPKGRILSQEQAVRMGEPPPVGKGAQERSEMVNREESERVNTIRIKTDLKTQETTAVDSTVVPPPVAAVSAFELLAKAGFDPPTAQRLARRRPLEVIQRQIDWLPLRHSTRNRLGLLRRAIEGDWCKPDGTPEAEDLQLGRIFARHYYAAYHANPGEPAAQPLAKDTEMAARFVERLLALDRDPGKVPDWGRQFGGRMRDKHRNDARARPHLSAALVLYGDEFLQFLRQEASGRERALLGRSRAEREAARMPAYLDFLRAEEVRLQRMDPARYAGFTEERRRTRQRMTGGLFLASADTLARFDSEKNRLLAFAEAFADSIPDIWRWEATRLEAAGSAEIVRFGAPGPTGQAGASASGPVPLVSKPQRGMTQSEGDSREVQHNGKHDHA